MEQKSTLRIIWIAASMLFAICSCNSDHTSGCGLRFNQSNCVISVESTPMQRDVAIELCKTNKLTPEGTFGRTMPVSNDPEHFTVFWDYTKNCYGIWTPFSYNESTRMVVFPSGENLDVSLYQLNNGSAPVTSQTCLILERFNTLKKMVLSPEDCNKKLGVACISVYKDSCEKCREGQTCYPVYSTKECSSKCETTAIHAPPTLGTSNHTETTEEDMLAPQTHVSPTSSNPQTATIKISTEEITTASGPPVGIIVGVVLAAVVAIALIIIVGIVISRRDRLKACNTNLHQLL